MKASEELIKKIKEFEGCKLYAYRDSKGVLTVGVGHVKGVKPGMAITMAQAEAFLRSDLGGVEDYVNGLGRTFTQAQFDALVCLVFNIGRSAFSNSTLWRYIKQGGTQLLVAREWMRWVHCNGKVLNGLVKRRQWEAERYIGMPIYKNADDGKWYVRKN